MVMVGLACHPCAGGMGFRDQGLGFGFRACLGVFLGRTIGRKGLLIIGAVLRIKKP